MCKKKAGVKAQAEVGGGDRRTCLGRGQTEVIGLVVPGVGPGRRKQQGMDEAVSPLDPPALHVEAHAPPDPELGNDRAKRHRAVGVEHHVPGRSPPYAGDRPAPTATGRRPRSDQAWAFEGSSSTDAASPRLNLFQGLVLRAGVDTGGRHGVDPFAGALAQRPPRDASASPKEECPRRRARRRSTRQGARPPRGAAASSRKGAGHATPTTRADTVATTSASAGIFR